MSVELYADLIILLCHLVIAENYAKWLPKNNIKQPKEHVVRVARNFVLELALGDHNGYINHHYDERYEIHNTENSNHQVLVENGRDKESHKKRR